MNTLTRLSIVTIFAGLAFNVNAMRCGTNLINEGDSRMRMLELCGSPSENTFSNITYLNKDNDGMNYYVHIDSNGIIDGINYSRGGLR